MLVCEEEKPVNKVIETGSRTKKVALLVGTCSDEVRPRFLQAVGRRVMPVTRHVPDRPSERLSTQPLWSAVLAEGRAPL